MSVVSDAIFATFPPASIIGGDITFLALFCQKKLFFCGIVAKTTGIVKLRKGKTVFFCRDALKGGAVPGEPDGAFQGPMSPLHFFPLVIYYGDCSHGQFHQLFAEVSNDKNGKGRRFKGQAGHHAG
jgi:hypothetical protein